MTAQTNSFLFTDDFGGIDVEIRLCAKCAEMAIDKAKFRNVRILPDPDTYHRACEHVRGRTR